jgi:hypothetical protein
MRTKMMAIMTRMMRRTKEMMKMVMMEVPVQVEMTTMMKKEERETKMEKEM